jgi:hypothetical protein
LVTEEGYQQLFDFIAGNHPYQILGNGIHTYPEGDENQKSIFADCLELERRGLIFRFKEDRDAVIWKAKTEKEGEPALSTMIRNLTTKSDTQFLRESIDALLAAIAAGRAWDAEFWAVHAASFARIAGLLN